MKKSLKIRLLTNVQTVHRQLISPQGEEIRIQTVCGVELAARPSKTSPYFFWKIFNFQNKVAFLFHRKDC